jgi:uncharacterized protein (DUF1501 family)
MINRREFLKFGAVGAGGAAAARVVPSLLDGGHDQATATSPSTPSASSTAATTAARTSDTKSIVSAEKSAVKSSGDRVLVVIDLAGGNDGLNTVVPINDPAYRTLRTAVALPEKDLHPLGKDYAAHPSLGRLAKRGLAVVAGVGVANPDGSHFEMSRRWAMADLDGKGATTTGFFGRLADVIGNKDAPAVALGLGSGYSPALVSAWAPSINLRSLQSAEMFRPNRDDANLTAFQTAYRRMATTTAKPGDRGPRAEAANGMTLALRTAGLVAASGDDGDDGLPGSDLGRSLASALRLISQPSLGLRIIHITHDGFDTHSSAIDQQAQRLNEFDEAVDAFLRAAEAKGLGDRVLVATTSEFGRRAKDNGSNGLDHGAASVALLAGPVNAGVHGEYASLTKLDRDDNLIANVSMGDYFATLSTWLGVNADEVLGKGRSPVAGVLRN